MLCSWSVFLVLILAAGPLPSQWVTATRTWWRPEPSRCSGSTPTRVSCTTIWFCTPRGCKPRYLTSCLCATLSTQGMSAHFCKTQSRHVNGYGQAWSGDLALYNSWELWTCSSPAWLLIDTWCLSMNRNYLPHPRVIIHIMICINRDQRTDEYLLIKGK